MARQSVSGRVQTCPFALTWGEEPEFRSRTTPGGAVRRLTSVVSLGDSGCDLGCDLGKLSKNRAYFVT